MADDGRLTEEATRDLYCRLKEEATDDTDEEIEAALKTGAKAGNRLDKI